MQQFQESPIYFIVVYLYEKINEHHLDSRQKHGFKQFIVNILKETILSETKVPVEISGNPTDLNLIKSLHLQYTCIIVEEGIENQVA